MIPRTYPSRVNSTTGRVEALVSFISSTTGLQRWVDYTPVAFVTDATPVEGSYNNNGYIAVADVGSTTGLQAGKDYIRVFLDPNATDVWRVNSVGFIPVGYSGIGGIPYALFANNEQGVWYDPSDRTTLFQDSAGTTPVTAVEQPVGLILDKSKGLVLGSELIPTLDLSNNMVWTTVGSLAGISTNSFTNTSGSAAGRNTNGIVTAGKTFNVSVSYTKTNAAVSFSVYSNSGTPQATSTANSGTLSCIIVSTTNQLYLRLSGNDTVTVTSISVRELPGNHAFQATSTSRPVLSARYNLLTKTEQFDDAVWAKTGLQAFGSGSTANATIAPDGTQTADLLTESATSGNHRVIQTLGTLQPQTITVAIRHKAGPGSRNIDFAITGGGSNYVSTRFSTITGEALLSDDVVGSVFSGKQVSVSGPDAYGFFTATISVTILSAVSVSVIYGLANGTSNNYTGNGTSGIYLWGADLRVTNDAAGQPAYQRVNTATDYDTTGFKPYLRFDGTDDWMQTNSINFTATDKMTVFAGVRKLSDAARGIVAELGNAPGTDAGIFNLNAPVGASASYAYRSVGKPGSSVGLADVTSGYTAPITNVLTGLGNISGDSAILRIDGAQAASGTTDQGTGNYGNYPLYIGRRGGTTLPFNGRIYGLIVRGAATTTATIQATETYMNGKTGAY